MVFLVCVFLGRGTPVRCETHMESIRLCVTSNRIQLLVPVHVHIPRSRSWNAGVELDARRQEKLSTHWISLHLSYRHHPSLFSEHSSLVS